MCNRRHRGKCWVQYPEEAPGHLRDAYKKRHNNWKADKGKNKSPDNNKSTSDIEDYGLTLLESINIPRVRALMYQYLDEPTIEPADETVQPVAVPETMHTLQSDVAQPAAAIHGHFSVVILVQPLFVVQDYRSVVLLLHYSTSQTMLYNSKG